MWRSLVAMFVVLLGACSGSDADIASVAGTDSDVATTTPATLATVDSVVPNSSSTTEAASTTVTTVIASSTTTPVFALEPPDADADFCEFLVWLNESGTPLESSEVPDPETLETYFTALSPVLDQAVAMAPPEVQEDITLLHDGIDVLAAGLADVDWVFFALDPESEAGQVISSDLHNEAADRLDAWESLNCP